MFTAGCTVSPCSTLKDMDGAPSRTMTMNVRDDLHPIALGATSGSFGSRPPNGVNHCQAVFGEMLEAFDHLVAKPPYERERSSLNARAASRKSSVKYSRIGACWNAASFA